MILPKDVMDKIEYFEHTVEQGDGTKVYDVFTIHFNAWWRFKRKIKIARSIQSLDKETSVFSHTITPGAADLYKQLNGYAIATHTEKLDSITKKYDKDKNNDNVFVLKPKPKIDD